jgi:hypothetical protein
MVSILAALARTSAIPLHLVRGEDLHGRACWFFVLAPQRSAEAFAAQKTGTVDVNSMGQIVASGWGDEPDEATAARMKAEYGWNPPQSVDAAQQATRELEIAD